MKVVVTGLEARHVAAHSTAPSALRLTHLDIAPGEQIAVIGPSGAGKTTLLEVVAGALKPTIGVVELDGSNPWSLNGRAQQRLRGRLFLAPQTPPLPPRQRVMTSVLAGALPGMSLFASIRSLFYPTNISAAHDALEAFDLAEKLFERVDRLSGGERQRVGLARALLTPASLWLIDEPLSSLDPHRAQQALATLTEAAKERSATLVVTLHQVDAALANFPRIIGLREGEMVFDLPVAEVSPQRLTELYAQHEDELDALLTRRLPEAAEQTARQPSASVVNIQCR